MTVSENGTPPHDIQMTAATVDDSEMISELHYQLFDQGWSTSVVRDLIEDPACDVRLVTDETAKTPIGFIIVRTTVDEAEVLSLAVSAPWQGRGVGRQVIHTTLRQLASEAVKTLFLEVAADNKAARRLYERCGFHQKGVRRGYYRRAGDNACDALVLAVAPSQDLP